MAKTVVHQDLKSLWGDEDHLKAAQNTKFSDLVFELLSERKPTLGESKIFELILNLSIDHGSETPSAVKTIETAKEGKSISESVAAGIFQIDDVHGGAIEPLMEIIYKIKDGKTTAHDLVNDYRTREKKVAGFGHRIYKVKDPRASLIISQLEELLGVSPYTTIASELEMELLKQTGKKLPLNIDGAIAVVLCSFDWEPRLGKAVFIIARTPGLCGQFLNSA